MEALASLDVLLRRYGGETPPASAAGAAVVIVLRNQSPSVDVLLIERASRAEDPASGQVGLPGGRVDPRDVTLRDTAMRELKEEVGLSASDAVGPPRFVSLESAPRFGMTVGVFALALHPAPPWVPALDPQEVSSIFWLPLERLDSRVRVARETPAGSKEVDAVVFEGHVLWGFTLRVLSQFKERAER